MSFIMNKMRAEKRPPNDPQVTFSVGFAQFCRVDYSADYWSQESSEPGISLRWRPVLDFEKVRHSQLFPTGHLCPLSNPPVKVLPCDRA
jgi:hypothetical protein